MRIKATSASNSSLHSVVKTAAFYSVLACLSFSLSGCGMFFGDHGVFRNRENDYLKADNIPPLVLPAGTHSAAMGGIG